MRVAAGTHFGIELFAVRIAGYAHPRPMIESVAQALIAAPAHDHDRFFAAALSDGSRTGVTAQGVVISVCNRLRGLAEHGGGDLSSHSWQGQKHFGVTMLGGAG